MLLAAHGVGRYTLVVRRLRIRGPGAPPVASVRRDIIRFAETWLGDTGLVTEPATSSPFRRFPWIQFVFCLACLTMTAWTWMRYSYCWGVTIPCVKEGMGPWKTTFGEEGFRGDTRRWPLDAYVTVQGRAGNTDGPSEGTVGFVTLKDPLDIRQRLSVKVPRLTAYRYGDRLRVTGRMSLAGDVQRALAGLEPFYVFSQLDTTASRFHPTSIAGLVVGAMGCFIFGLYLRSWLRERKALACGLPQDMTV
jgi:hypothetical protein